MYLYIYLAISSNNFCLYLVKMFIRVMYTEVQLLGVKMFQRNKVTCVGHGICKDFGNNA